MKKDEDANKNQIKNKNLKVQHFPDTQQLSDRHTIRNEFNYLF